MRYSKRAWVAVTVLPLVVAGLTACAAPGQKDSADKVDTATEVQISHQASTSESTEVSASGEDSAENQTLALSSPDEPQLIDCMGTAQYEPSQIVLDCMNPASMVSDITWTAWDQNLAQGTGTMTVTGTDGMPTQKNVAVELGTPLPYGNGSSFTTISIDGVIVTNSAY